MMDKQNFLTFLSKNYPHLYRVEMILEEIRTNTKHGNVFIDLRVVRGVVDKYEVNWSESGFLTNRKDNKLTE